MPLTSLGQIALPVSDARRAQAFYADVLGLRFLYRFGDLVFFDCGGVRLLLEVPPLAAQNSPTNGVCLYFKVHELENVYAELQAKGVVFSDEPHLIARMSDHELWMVFFADPDGN
ncbi:MAG: VOC family protein, partial [Candidatus Methylophosphatis roskildensis]